MRHSCDCCSPCNHCTASLFSNPLTTTTATVKRKDGESEPAVIGRGVRQGCMMSPSLFDIFEEVMVRTATENYEQGVEVGGQLIKSVRLADGQALVAVSEKGLQETMDRLNAVVEDFGMRANVKKTKMMRFNRNGEGDAMIKLNDKNLEQVKSFKYLGSIFSNNGCCSEEIKSRIMLAKIAFNSRRELLSRGWE